MKALKTVVFFTLFSLFFSCSDVFDSIDNDSVELPPRIEIVKVEVPQSFRSSGRTEEVMLKFRDETVLSEVCSELSLLTAADKLEYIGKIGDFPSMYTLYERAMAEAESYYDREGGYEEFKAKYPDFYYPERDDDYGAYLPFQNPSLSCLASEYGNLMIGDNIVQNKRITTYEELQGTGQALYDKVREIGESSIVQTDPDPTNIYAYYLPLFSDWSGAKRKVGGDAFEHNTDWIKVGDGKKLKVTFGRITRTVYRVGLPMAYRMDWHVEISFRKKGFLGCWYNYSSRTDSFLSVKYDSSEDYKDISGIGVRLTANGVSSHDFYIPAQCIHIPLYSGGGVNVFNVQTREKEYFAKWLYDMPAYSAVLDVTYRGMSGSKRFTFEGEQMWGFADGVGDKLVE